MSKRYKTFIKIISLMLAFLTLFNTVSYSFAEAVSIQPQKNSTKKLINADIGELPDKLPKEKLELKSKTTIEDLINEIRRRDDYDTNRKISPLKKASDAIEIDTSDMNIEEVSKKIIYLFINKGVH